MGRLINSIYLRRDKLAIFTITVYINIIVCKYSRTSVARTLLGPWKLVRDRGSSSKWGLIKAPGQEA